MTVRWEALSLERKIGIFCKQPDPENWSHSSGKKCNNAGSKAAHLRTNKNLCSELGVYQLEMTEAKDLGASINH